MDVLHTASATTRRDQPVAFFLATKADPALVGLGARAEGTNGDLFGFDSKDLGVLDVMHFVDFSIIRKGRLRG